MAHGPHFGRPLRMLRGIEDQAGLIRAQAHTGAVTLIQRFGSAANLNIHLHCLVLDGVYRLMVDVLLNVNITSTHFHQLRGAKRVGT